MIPHRKNAIPSVCSTCSARVPAKKGHWVSGRAICAACVLTTAPLGDVVARCALPYGDGWTVSPYQLTGANFLSSRWAALLSDHMGLGKTAQAILALDPGTPVVIVCPSQVKAVWYREITTWGGRLRPRVLAGRNGWRPPGPDEAVILNYAILPPILSDCSDCSHPGPRHNKSEGCKEIECLCDAFRCPVPDPSEVAEVLGLLPGTVLIADECHKLKTLSATRTKRFRWLAAGATRVWGLSASPILNHPRELWALYRVLGLAAAAFPGGVDEFNALTQFYDDWQAAPEHIEKVFETRRARVEMGRTAEVVGLQLPELRFDERIVPISRESRQVIESALSQALAARRVAQEIKRGHLDPEKADDRRDELALVSHTDEDVQELLEAVLTTSDWADIAPQLATLRKALALAKIPAALQYAQECAEAQEPLVAFSAHVAPVEALGGLPGWVSLRNASKRTATITRFQAGELAGVSGTIRGSSEGITLTRGRLLLFVDRDWTPEANMQALKRIHRRGQTRGCLITTLVADHEVDRYVARTNRRKEAMIQSLSRGQQ